MQGCESNREQKQSHFTIALLIAQLFLFLTTILTSRVRFQSSHSLSFNSLNPLIITIPSNKHTHCVSFDLSINSCNPINNRISAVSRLPVIKECVSS